MARALGAVGALLAVAFAVLLVVVFATREEDRVAVDDLLSLELTRSIGVSEGGDGRPAAARARATGTACSSSRRARRARRCRHALGSEFNGDLPFGSTGALFVFAAGDALVRFADYRGRARFAGFEEPVDELARADALLAVDDGVRGAPA